MIRQTSVTYSILTDNNVREAHGATIYNIPRDEFLRLARLIEYHPSVSVGIAAVDGIPEGLIMEVEQCEELDDGGH